MSPSTNPPPSIRHPLSFPSQEPVQRPVSNKYMHPSLPSPLHFLKLSHQSLFTIGRLLRTKSLFKLQSNKAIAHGHILFAISEFPPCIVICVNFEVSSVIGTSKQGEVPIVKEHFFTMKKIPFVPLFPVSKNCHHFV